MNIRTVFATILLSVLGGATSASAALVTYIFTGRTSASIGGSPYANVDYKIDFTIDDGATDEAPGLPNRGNFRGGEARLTVTPVNSPQDGFTNKLSTNITGIVFLGSAGISSQSIFLVNPNNFGNTAVAATYGSGGLIDDVNKISPFIGILPREAGTESGGVVTWNFADAPNVKFNVVSSFYANNAAAVPEPSVLAACVMGISAVCLWWRKKRPVAR